MNRVGGPPPNVPIANGGYAAVPMAPLTRTNVSEIVQVPAELAAFAADPQFQTILLKVKEQSKINFITLNRNADRTAAESIMIDAPSNESALLARKVRGAVRCDAMRCDAMRVSGGSACEWTPRCGTVLPERQTQRHLHVTRLGGARGCYTA